MLRTILITRRFWPLVGGAEVVMSNLATEFIRLGHSAKIITARWEPHWPTEIVHREASVVRLPNPKQRGWGTFRYMLALSRWLQQNRQSFDVVLVSMLKHDAYSAIGAMRKHNIPVVLRVEGTGETGDCHWQTTARFGRRIRSRCHSADAIVAPSERAEQELLESGYGREQVRFIPNGAVICPPRTDDSRWQSRLALADINPNLASKPDTKVVVYTGRLHKNKGLVELVYAFRRVVDQLPDSRLWLIGEGPLRDELYQLTGDLELRGHVMMPGAFDDIEDLLIAADAYVLPSYEEGMSVALLEAMGAELPVIASDIAGNRTLVKHGENGLLVEPKKVQPLAEAIFGLLQPDANRQNLASAARSMVVDNYSVTRTAESFIELFEELQQTQ